MSAIQYLSFFSTIFDLILCLILLKLYKNIRIYLLNAVVYLSHVLLFYLALIEESLDHVIRPYPEFFTQWSGLLRFHGIITGMFILLYFVKWNIVIDHLIELKKFIREKLWN